MSRLKSIVFIHLLFVFTANDTLSQTIKENWLLVKAEDNSKLYINTSNLNIAQKNDIYVWILEEFDNALELEGIESRVYQTKTYYLINKERMRYSILQINFFDQDKNVLKSYNYDHNSDLPEFKYDTPIIKGSDVEAILNKCIEFEKPKVD